MSANRPLIIVSNRLPLTVARGPDGRLTVTPSSGGLVAGLSEVHAQNGSLWVGHSGEFSDVAEDPELAVELKRRRFVPVRLSEATYLGYYEGASNGAVWPLFHYFQEAMRFDWDDWRCYEEANRSFAQTIAELAQPGSRVWIHDYQLMLVPALLRGLRSDLQIGYFHHIPFPSSEIFRVLPSRDAVLLGLLGCDLIGFHTIDYVRHFLVSVTRVLGRDIDVDAVHYDGRLVRVGTFPLGVDAHAMQSAGASPAAREQVAQILGDHRDQTILLGVDRLDYTKGIPERLAAFRQFLMDNPAYVGQVTLIQICVPSRVDIATYGSLRAIVERLVGQINGEFGRPGYTPVQYVFRSLPREEVAALYKVARVAVVTPLRDGLNLVCKEYVAARERGDGVLILSEFAGASAEMGEAILVNPYDVNGQAAAMRTAVEMSGEEQRRRMGLLRRRVLEHDNLAWSDAFVESLDEAGQRNITQCHRLAGTRRERVVERITRARRVFLFLDHDGTLTPIAPRPELALPSPEVLNLLESFRQLPAVTLAVVTGRSREFCLAHFGELPTTLIAEHGAFIRPVGSRDWQVMVNMEEFQQLRPNIMGLLELYSRCVPGSLIEEKETALVWHYRLAEPIFAKSQALELSEALTKLLANTPFAALHGKKNIEICPVGANKGRAVESILTTLEWRPEDAIITIGDDKTDEGMHRVHPEHNLAIHVGNANLFAKYYLDGPRDVLALLAELHDRLRPPLMVSAP